MEKLKSLIEVKKIIAIMMSIVFCIMSLTGRISSEHFVTTFLIIIGFYYSQSSIRQALNEKK